MGVLGERRGEKISDCVFLIVSRLFEVRDVLQKYHLHPALPSDSLQSSHNKNLLSNPGKSSMYSPYSHNRPIRGSQIIQTLLSASRWRAHSPTDAMIITLTELAGSEAKFPICRLHMSTI